MKRKETQYTFEKRNEPTLEAQIRIASRQALHCEPRLFRRRRDFYFGVK